MAVRSRLLTIALLGIWVGLADRNVSGAGGLNPYLCEEMCSASPGCGTECWRNQWEFDNEYPASTCGDEEYSCCGDESCWPLYEGCNYCQQDCGTVPACANECLTSAQCDYGYYCNASRECVRAPEPQGQSPLICGGACTSDIQCCGNDQCLPHAGGKICEFRSTTYCPSSQSCNSNNDCDQWVSGLNLSCTYGVKEVFCDPGIDRCQFVWGPDCPSSTNLCKPSTVTPLESSPLLK